MDVTGSTTLSRDRVLYPQRMPGDILWHKNQSAVKTGAKHQTLVARQSLRHHPPLSRHRPWCGSILATNILCEVAAVVGSLVTRRRVVLNVKRFLSVMSVITGQCTTCHVFLVHPRSTPPVK